MHRDAHGFVRVITAHVRYERLVERAFEKIRQAARAMPAVFMRQLDALTRIEMQSLLETAWRREGFTALLVTHDVAEAITLADRIVLLEDGAVALDLEVAPSRPRLRGSPEFGRLEETILDRLLRPSRGR